MKKILLIEDDLKIQQAYKFELTRAGFDLTIAEDGFRGLSMIKEVNPDLIILDLILPKKNGFDILKELGGEEFTKQTPIIILSVLGQKPDIKRGLELGATDYLVKSETTIEQVVSKIKQYLGDK